MNSEPKTQLNWKLFLGLLLAPAVLTFAAASMHNEAAIGTMLVSTFGGSAVAGISCGIILARRYGESLSNSVLIALGAGFLLTAVSFGLCCGGCIAAEQLR